MMEDIPMFILSFNKEQNKDIGAGYKENDYNETNKQTEICFSRWKWW